MDSEPTPLRQQQAEAQAKKCIEHMETAYEGSLEKQADAEAAIMFARMHVVVGSIYVFLLLGLANVDGYGGFATDAAMHESFTKPTPESRKKAAAAPYCRFVARHPSSTFPS